ncbi:MAG: hypothetical protein NHB15_15070 [Methanosarcina barkeri]|nr:hypothetical protein [Methanosarcina sp. ERenArc_MAG2]
MLLDVVSSLLSITEFINRIHSKATYKSKLKEALFKDFEYEAQKFLEACDDFLLNNYTLIGAYLLGTIIPPSDPSKISDKIITQINSSFFHVEVCLSQVTKTMKSHENGFKTLFESDPELLILFENFLCLMGDNKKIDFSYCANKKSLIGLFISQDFDNSFVKNLNESTNKISYLTQVNEINWINKPNVGNALEILNDKQFFEELLCLIDKYLKLREVEVVNQMKSS